MPVHIQTNLAGWGCNCRAFRLGEPTPEQAIRALARSANVTVERKSDTEFIAWTNPEDRYNVEYDPNYPGGFCKHTTACLIEFAPWHRQIALGAQDLLDEIHELKKQKRALERKLK